MALCPPILPARCGSQQLPALDGFRAVAAFLVVFYHAGLPVSGGLGVLGFFVLSGFLITWLLLKEDDRYGSISVKKFYARRSLRIFPAFYCYWLFAIALGLVIHKPIGSGQAWSSFFYFNNYYQAIVGDPNSSLSHTWSLAIEEQFYLLWPTVFLMFRRSRAHLLRALTITIVGVWGWRVLATLYLNLPQGYRYEAFDMRMDHLAIGCWLAVALREGYFPRLWRAMCASAFLPVLTCLAITGSMILALRLGPTYRDTVGGIVDPVLIAILLTQLLAFHDAPAWRAFNWPWVAYLGRIWYWCICTSKSRSARPSGCLRRGRSRFGCSAW